MPIVACAGCGARNRVEERGTGVRPVCGRCGNELAAPAGVPVELTDATFEAVLSRSGERPVLVDCWAPWCGPCRMLTPTIEALAAEARDRYVVAKLNIDENPGVANRFNVRSIPTMLFFKRGQLVDQLVGLQSKSAIEARLRAHLPVEAGARAA